MRASAQREMRLLIRGPSTQLSTSVPLEWDGIVVERHIVAAGERGEQRRDRHIIELADDWALRALRICVRAEADLPLHARELVRHLAPPVG